MGFSAGFVALVTVNNQQASFQITTTPDQFAGPFFLFSDAPNTHTIPQVELARRSWFLSLVQSAMVQKDLVMVTYDDAGKLVSEIDVSPLSPGDVNFNFEAKQPVPMHVFARFAKLRPAPRP